MLECTCYQYTSNIHECDTSKMNQHRQVRGRSCPTSPTLLLGTRRLKQAFLLSPCRCHARAHRKGSKGTLQCNDCYLEILKFFTCRAGDMAGRVWACPLPTGSRITCLRRPRCPDSGQQWCYLLPRGTGGLFAPDTFPTGHLLQPPPVTFQ